MVGTAAPAGRPDRAPPTGRDALIVSAFSIPPRVKGSGVGWHIVRRHTLQGVQVSPVL
jgi:hypothetical protein